MSIRDGNGNSNGNSSTSTTATGDGNGTNSHLLPLRPLAPPRNGHSNSIALSMAMVL